MSKRLITLLIAIFIIFAFSLSYIFPNNPNYNYVTINVGSTGTNFSNNTTVSFYLDVQGYTHNFSISPSPPAGQSGNLSYMGLEVLYLAPANYSGVNQQFINNCILPNLSLYPILYAKNFLITNECPNLTINWNEIPPPSLGFPKSVMSGYYFFYLIALKSNGKYNSEISVDYKNDYFKIS
ncbi:MAG: hypothetical protein ACYDAO_06200 [Thermoplasmataceae archaeon]